MERQASPFTRMTRWGNILIMVVVLLCVLVGVEGQAKTCTWKCKEKNTVAVPNPIIPNLNGCAGNDEKWMPDMVVVSGQYNYHNCCNEQDQCYQTCGMPKEVCDKSFLQCMYKYCSNVEIGEMVSTSLIFLLLLFYN